MKGKSSIYAVGGFLPSVWCPVKTDDRFYMLSEAKSENTAWRDYLAHTTQGEGLPTGVRDYALRTKERLNIRRPSCSEVLGTDVADASIFIHTYGTCRDDLGEPLIIDVWHGGTDTVMSVLDKVLTDLYTSSPISSTPATLHGDISVDFEYYVEDVRACMSRETTFGDAVHALLGPGPLEWMDCDLYFKIPHQDVTSKYAYSLRSADRNTNAIERI